MTDDFLLVLTGEGSSPIAIAYEVLRRKTLKPEGGLLAETVAGLLEALVSEVFGLVEDGVAVLCFDFTGADVVDFDF